MEKSDLTKLFTVNNKNGLKTIEKYCKDKYSELYKKIISWHRKYYKKENFSFKEKIYLYINDIKRKPICSNKECNNNTKFTNSLVDGYRKYCSQKCSGDSQETKNNRKKTNLKNFGFENPMYSPEVKNKNKESNILKFGVDNYSKTDEFKTKMKIFNNEKYGVDHYSQTDEFKEKYSKTMNEKYGVDHYSQTKEYKEKYLKTMNDRYGVKNPQELKSTKIKNVIYFNEKIKKKFLKKGYEILEFIENDLVIKHPDGHIFKEDRHILQNRFNTNTELSTKLLPLKNSKGELSICNFLDSINIDYLKNKRKILKKFEIDVYIPSHNLGIEYNGIYYHSNLFRKNDYHISKTNCCIENNIKLLQIFEDEWFYKENIIKSIIKSNLNIFDFIVNQESTCINYVETNIKELFLNENDIKGNVNSDIYIGLFYKNDLVNIMCLNKKNKNNFEIVRFTNKLNYNIVGGENKLLKHFIEKYKPSSLKIFVDKRFSNGDNFQKLNFKVKEYIKPDFYYIVKNLLIRYPKSEINKDNINKFLKIYDCGQIKLELKLE